MPVANITWLGQTLGRANPVERRRLQLASARPVLRLMRLRHRDNRPLSYEIASLALDRLPGLDPNEPITADITELAPRHGVRLGKAEETTAVVSADATVARHLRVPRHTRVLRLDRVCETARGLPVKWRLAFMPGQLTASPGSP
jgi:GntR family transcriptional regulator